MEIQSRDDLVINVIRGCLIVTLPSEFTKEAMDQMSSRIPASVISNSAMGVVFDFTPVFIMDSEEFSFIHSIAEAVQLLGAKTVFVCLKPGTIAALLDMDLDTSQINARLNMEEGLDFILNETD